MADISRIKIPNGTEYTLKDAQAREDIAALNGSLENIKIEEVVNPTWASGFIRSENGTVGPDSAACVTGYVESTGFEYSYVSASGYKAKVAEYGTDKSYIGIKMPLSAGSNSFTIDNGNYFRVQLTKDTGELSPTDITSNIFGIQYSKGFTDTSLSKSGKPADAKAVGDAIFDNKTSLHELGYLDITNRALIIDGLWVNSSGVIGTDSGTKVAYYRCTKGEKFLITSESTGSFRVGTCNVFPSRNITLNDFQNGLSDKTIIANSDGYITIYTYPQLANFRLYKLVLFNDVLSASENDLHEYPQSVGVLNTIKRAKQAVEIKWTPKANLPRVYLLDGVGDKTNRIYKGEYTANKEYRGVPYSQADYSELNNYGYTSGDVGSYISFETFVSAVNNPNSILYKIPSDNYEYRATFYGLVCCSFLCRAFNLPTVETYRLTPNQNPQLIAYVDTVPAVNANAIKLGYFVQNSAHVGLITDIIRDNSGTVTHIEVSEQSRTGNASRNIVGGESGGISRCRLWSLADFRSHFSNYTLMKYKYINDVPYTPCEGTTLKNETELYMPNAFPCMPYLGNKFTYRHGYLYNKDILIDSDEYTHLRVLKDGSPFTLIAVNGASKVTVDFSDVGYYEAYLCTVDGNNDDVYGSVSCEWAVVDDSTSATISGDTINVVCDVAEGDVPYAVRIAPYSSNIKYRDSSLALIQNPTVTDIADGKKRYTFAVNRNFNTEDSIRVEIQGKYNKWHTDWIQLA